jgi:hypothetical protein
LLQYDKAFKISTGLEERDPGNVGWRTEQARLYRAIAEAHDKLAGSLVGKRQFDAALGEYNAALEKRVEFVRKFP